MVEKINYYMEVPYKLFTPTESDFVITIQVTPRPFGKDYKDRIKLLELLKGDKGKSLSKKLTNEIS